MFITRSGMTGNCAESSAGLDQKWWHGSSFFELQWQNFLGVFANANYFAIQVNYLPRARVGFDHRHLANRGTDRSFSVRWFNAMHQRTQIGKGLSDGDRQLIDLDVREIFFVGTDKPLFYMTMRRQCRNGSEKAINMVVHLHSSVILVRAPLFLPLSGFVTLLESTTSFSLRREPPDYVLYVLLVYQTPASTCYNKYRQPGASVEYRRQLILAVNPLPADSPC
jgi:hypothetical protein